MGHARPMPMLLAALAAVGCGPPTVIESDGGPTDAATFDAALLDFDGTPRLTDCVSDSAPSRCAPSQEWMRGRWHFHFACPATSIWRVALTAEGASTTLEIVGTSWNRIAASTTPGSSHELVFTSHEALGTCAAIVELPTSSRFVISLVQIEPALDVYQCDELCLSDSAAGIERGCDCARTCHDACSDLGTDCGLPCNRDVPDYDCPYLESTIQLDTDCSYYESDTDSFEHRGRCYRCGTGQQCCYTEGRDNGTGSFDLCPPLDPGTDDPAPNGCSGVFEHCDCDVTPLCGCMAESGDLALCGECIGEGNLDLSCNAPGDDATFCQRAADAALAGFSWCAIVGDIGRCFDLPPDF